MRKEFDKFISDEDTIRRKLEKHYDEVIQSSLKNMVYASEIIDRIVEQPYHGKQMLDYKIRINILENISHAEKVMPQMKQSVPRQRPAVW